MTALGEYIELAWDDYPSIYAVRGHVTPEAFAASVAQHVDGAPYGQSRHTWAFWGQTAESRADDYRAVLLIRDQPGRGRFPVTVADALTRQQERERIRLLDEKRAGLNRDAKP